MKPIELGERLGRWSSGRGPLHVLLAARLRRLVDEGELPPGEPLPPDRALAAALAVGKGHIRSEPCGITCKDQRPEGAADQGMRGHEALWMPGEQPGQSPAGYLLHTCSGPPGDRPANCLAVTDGQDRGDTNGPAEQ